MGVVQSLADHDPDVDGIYRLTQPLPFTFPPSSRRWGSQAPVEEGRRLSEQESRIRDESRRLAERPLEQHDPASLRGHCGEG